MKKIIWLDEKKDEIIEMYNDGMKQVEISIHFNISQGSISTGLRKWGVSNSDSNRFRRVEIPKDALYDMYWNKKMRPREIGKIFKCSFTTILNKLKEHEIPRRTYSECHMGKLNGMYGRKHKEVTKAKIAATFVNEKRKIVGSNRWGTGAYYNTPNQGKTWMRSGWERGTASYLTDVGINWYYEYKWLEIDDHKYLPDFFIPEENKYIEVKGIKIQKYMEKLKLFMKKYNIELWDKKELLKRGIINSSGSVKIGGGYNN
jgi:hypothetical protein